MLMAAALGLASVILFWVGYQIPLSPGVRSRLGSPIRGWASTGQPPALDVVGGRCGTSSPDRISGRTKEADRAPVGSGDCPDLGNPSDIHLGRSARISLDNPACLPIPVVVQPDTSRRGRSSNGSAARYRSTAVGGVASENALAHVGPISCGVRHGDSLRVCCPALALDLSDNVAEANPYLPGARVLVRQHDLAQQDGLITPKTCRSGLGEGEGAIADDSVDRAVG
jgi:hypothetical protein